ncbi:hypothetical protein [Rossellomorea vietnamensis]|uniref:hypothetical protein n=1 Tax=Rossellomorea vietnamensis TaxID=218284 RepID=UPI000556B5F4|nr:hypothetical protein [Rossellomorea vietnamensis]
MDVSKGRCPNKQKGCECNRVCAALYGKHARSLRQDAMDETDPLKKEEKTRTWQGFINKYAKKI